MGKIIKTKKRLKKSLIQQLLTGRMRFPEFGEPVQGKGELPGGWREIKLGDILKVRKCSIEFDDNKDYPLISVRRRSGGLFHRSTLKGVEIATKNLQIAKAGDFLISKMQVVHGAMGLVTKDFDGMYVSGSYIALIPKSDKDCCIEYINFLSCLPEMYHAVYISSYGVHIEKMTFNLNLFLKTKIRMPLCIEEQTCIVAILETCQTEILMLQKKESALREQKKGLMQKLLTGEVRVKVKERTT